MQKQSNIMLKERIMKEPPILDHEFKPAYFENIEYLNAVKEFCESEEIDIAIERDNNKVDVFHLNIFPQGIGMDKENLKYVERLIKAILLIKGGWRIQIYGSDYIYYHIKKVFTSQPNGNFFYLFASKVYGKELTVELVTKKNMVLKKYDKTKEIKRIDKGSRIGIDVGGSDIKVVAVIDKEVVFSREIIWNPKENDNIQYHYEKLRSAIKMASKYLEHIDFIGVSSAGIIVDNEVKLAALFKKVPESDSNDRVQKIYSNLAKEFNNVKCIVNNDGDITALTLARNSNDIGILGISMGTSEGAGYITRENCISGWLNELSSVSIDYNKNAEMDWTYSQGCGGKYFSQQAVIRLAKKANIGFESGLTDAEKLEKVQELIEKNNEKACEIFKTIGAYLGYTIPYYLQFYDIKRIIILGRLTSGKSGQIIADTAKKVLSSEFKDICEKIEIVLPNESEKRVGQAITVATFFSE